jgi:AbrB family looped-hinge helix DNA binding protein
MLHHHFDKKSVGTTVVGERGQIVIPSAVRERLNLKRGDKLLVFTKHDKFIGLLKTDEIDQVLDHITEKFNTTMQKIRKNIKEE